MESPAGDAEPGGEAAKPITVFLLDDHEIVRAGVRDLLETDPGIVVVGAGGHRGLSACPHPGAPP